MAEVQNGIEVLYSIRQIADLWRISQGQVRRLFLHRPGMVNLSEGLGRATWRIPRSLALSVMVECGYAPEPIERGVQQ